MKQLKIGVLASGRGSNFQAIIDSTESGAIKGSVSLLLTDNPDAYAIERAKKHGIEYVVLSPGDFASKDVYYAEIAECLISREISMVVLAGFMRIVGKPLIEAYRNRMINIHPAILPSFPGLHGQKQAVDYGVKIAGCTVHFVDEGMDTGPIIAQAAVPVYYEDTEDTISERILKMEHKILPYAIQLFAEGRLEVIGRKVRIRNLTQKDISIISPAIDYSFQ